MKLTGVTGGSTREEWWIEVEHDVFDLQEGAVVSIHCEVEDAQGSEETLVTPSPADARLIAQAIVEAADLADKQNQGAGRSSR